MSSRHADVVIVGAVLWAMTAGALGLAQSVEEGDIRVGTCRAYRFTEEAWDHLVLIEPRIQEHLSFIQEASHQGSGENVKVTTCSVRWPVASDGAAVDGLRTVIIDHVWETITNGERRYHHVGMKVAWNESRTESRNELGHRVTTIKREVKGLLLCWGPTGCSEMGIPYPKKRGGDATLIPRAP